MASTYLPLMAANDSPAHCAVKCLLNLYPEEKVDLVPSSTTQGAPCSTTCHLNISPALPAWFAKCHRWRRHSPVHAVYFHRLQLPCTIAIPPPPTSTKTLRPATGTPCTTSTNSTKWSISSSAPTQTTASGRYWW